MVNSLHFMNKELMWYSMMEITGKNNAELYLADIKVARNKKYKYDLDVNLAGSMIKPGVCEYDTTSTKTLRLFYI